MITKKVISFFTFGIFLILIGSISKLFNWSQSSLIMAIGLVFEILAALLYIWEKLKRK